MGGAVGPIEWDTSRVGDLHGLLRDALPGEELAAEDLAGVVFDRTVPRVVLASPVGDAAIAVGAHGRTGSVDVLVVAPSTQRRGLGSGLLAAGMDWLRSHGCDDVVAGGHPPRYLWAGVDREWIAGMALLERAGFTRGAAIVNLSCPTDPIRPAGSREAGVQRVGDDTAAAVLAGCGQHFPHWAAELAIGIDRRRAFVAVDDGTGEVLGFACHGVCRSGWFGPMATFPAGKGHGVGSALLAATLDDLRAEGQARCEISWVGPVAFYAKVAAVRAGRTFVAHRRALRGD